MREDGSCAGVTLALRVAPLGREWEGVVGGGLEGGEVWRLEGPGGVGFGRRWPRLERRGFS